MKDGRRAEGLGLPILQTMHDSRSPDGPESVHRGLPFFFRALAQVTFFAQRQNLTLRDICYVLVN